MDRQAIHRGQSQRGAGDSISNNRTLELHAHARLERAIRIETLLQRHSE